MKIRGKVIPALLATGLIAAPLAGATPAFAADDPDEIVDISGDMQWDVVSSWKNYVEGFAQGSINSNWSPSGTLNLDTGAIELDLGSIEWESELHGFHIAFTNTQLKGELGGDAVITADISSNRDDVVAGDKSHAEIEIAAFNLMGSLGEDGTVKIDGAEGVVDSAIDQYILAWGDYAGEAAAPLALNLTADLPDDDDDGDVAWQPKIQILDDSSNALGDSEITQGDKITVRGTGFDPDTNESNRPPIPIGSPPGYYIVFGKFAPDWKPSDGNPPAARPNSDQRWALTAEVLEQVDAKFRPQIDAQWVELTTDGSFEATLEAADVDNGPENGIYGVYVYAAGGSDNPTFEVMQPVNYAPAQGGGDDDPVWEPQFELFDEKDNALGDAAVLEGDVITVRGTGFDPEANVGGRGIPIPADLPQGFYVVFGKFAPNWKPSADVDSDARKTGDRGWILAESILDQVPTDFQGAIRSEWVPLGEDGSFEAQLEASDLEDGPENGIYGIYIYPAGGINNADYELMQAVKYEPTAPGNGGQEPGYGEDDKCLAADSGSLTWNIHTGFLSYIDNLSDGNITLNGVTESSAGFKFDLASGNYDSDAKSGVIKFTGSVHFTGHGGALDVKMANPQLHINQNEATLLVDVTTDGQLEKNVPFGVVDAKSAQTSANSYALNSAGAVLTGAGSTAMQGFYDAGETIAPVTTEFKLGGQGDCGDDLVSEEKPTTPKPPAPQKPDNTPINLGPAQQADEKDVPMCRSTQGASLNWGVKQSFVDYVTGPIAAGSISTANGVSGQFNWPGRTANFDPESAVGEFSFGGTVTFTGHDDALNLRISNPRVKITSASSGQLFANVRATNPAGEVTVDASGVHIANLNVSGKKSVRGDTITFSSVPATLTASGVPAFAEFYEAGSALNSLSLTVTLGPEVPCDTLASGTTVLPRTGSDLDLAAAGAAFLLLGLGTVAVRRRVRATA